MQMLKTLSLLAAVCVTAVSADPYGPLDAIDINVPKPAHPPAEAAKLKRGAPLDVIDTNIPRPARPPNNGKRNVMTTSAPQCGGSCGGFDTRYIGCYRLEEEPVLVERERGENCAVACYRAGFNFAIGEPDELGLCRCLSFVDGATRLPDFDCSGTGCDTGHGRGPVRIYETLRRE
ncbi:hypothetical protein BZA05DRAFT_442041 [Tricharina praecox]|uniref:uncharacterized protein n=1 Tax=Tricharina praecox TaxID=43433 RepID=UPI002220B4B8|nr:uncharacterized protein BZA05DRAFT_442041 [Tricharina praecox]KAI5856348.1 hypothetical protein BZA05DRAFT_442041 [Tricharina praecox]